MPKPSWKPGRGGRIRALQLKAVQKTDNDKRLFRIWKKSRYEDVRIAVICKLKDQASLGHIARKETLDGLRCEAVKRLDDKALLAKIAKEDRDDFVRFMAQKKFEYTGSEPWYASKEMDEDVLKTILTILENDMD